MTTDVLTARPGTPADKAFDANVDTNRFRRRRLQVFLDHLQATCGHLDRIRLLDVGGSRVYWEATRDLWGRFPLEITIINLGAPSIDDAPYFMRPGNACAMPEYADGAFDMIHSNSVIEHVGGWENMMAMANEIRRVAPHYYLQTPNFGFPFEPHFRTPFFHWYPEQVRARMLMSKRRGFHRPVETLDLAMRAVQSTYLLNRAQLSQLFPEARIEMERFMGFNKSLMAIR